ncbi:MULTISPECIES: aspartate aminotransferase family protein [unclassified Acinetobacter]|uniref:aspartate aminotransferase family protein n=1 Tax=unclassified Acinetobacter TaxID=196816 RepID=UPI00293510F1|nr:MULTISPECIES: aspartate aminotransferase family protein [unclassified Acinetobacter]WOE31739.1 aspartate aminotransferase family protein [Acinetobacter sp. SAAs470]WOE37206.1 aspartate aminotransferase family protein [Acinetobacter sp. SAAs474]
MSYLMPIYQPLDIELQHGQGCYLWDTQNRCYFDAISGVGVTLLGHAHPQIHQEIVLQSQSFLHLSNLFKHAWNERLAEKLAQISGLTRTFFCNSGTEANEAAIKLARLYGHHRGIQHPKIIVMHNAFHGRTLGALSATAKVEYRQPFYPLLSGFEFVAFNDLTAITKYQDDPDVVAVLLEPIQGEAGIHIASLPYLKQLRQYCDQQQWLLIFDEIQSGLGRTGTWFYHQQADICPDILTIAKGLANGLPIGACLTNEKLGNLFHTGTHGSTFGGNPLACRVAYSVLNILEQQYLADIYHKGQKLINLLQTQLTGLKHIRSVRGVGLMIGIELTTVVDALPQLACDQFSLLLNVTQGKVIRLLPPLIITDAEIEYLAQQIYLLCQTLDQSTHEIAS